jgi:hypothetical protein
MTVQFHISMDDSSVSHLNSTLGAEVIDAFTAGKALQNQIQASQNALFLTSAKNIAQNPS